MTAGGGPGGGSRTIERLDVVAAASVLGALAMAGVGLAWGGVPGTAALILGVAGFVVCSRARIEQPGGLRVTFDLQDAAVVAAALLLPAPEVWVVGVLGNGLAQFRRVDDPRIGATVWALALPGLAATVAVVDAVATSTPGPSWVLAAAAGSLTMSVCTWVTVRLVVGYVLHRPAGAGGGSELLLGIGLAVPAAGAGVLVAVAATVGWWTWFPISALAAAALAACGLVSTARVRMAYSMTLTHLQAVADAAEDEDQLLERCQPVLTGAVGGYVLTLDRRPRPEATHVVPVTAGLHLCAVALARTTALRRADVRLLEDVAALVGRTCSVLEQRRALEQDATTDALTGLGNRRLLEQVVEQRPGQRWGLVLIDLDNLKAVNDVLGHQAGDLLLQRVAGIFRASVRGGDVALRVGGDEFAVLTDDVGALAELESRLRHRLGRLGTPDELHVGASIGTAATPTDGTTVPELFVAADRRLYEQKRLVTRPRLHARAT